MKTRKNSKDAGRFQLSRLECMLISYEALCRWIYASMVSERKWHNSHDLPSSGGVINFKSIRNYLLSSRPGDKFDREHFGVPESRALAGLDYVTDSIAALHGWCSSSRRVYNIQEDLQLLLASTGFGRVTYGDIRFPFSSFAIMLDTPIHEGDQEYDCILVSEQEYLGCKGLLLVAVSKYIEEAVLPFDKLSKQLLQAVQTDDGVLSRKVLAQHDQMLWTTPHSNVRPWFIPTSAEILLNELVVSTTNGKNVVFKDKAVLRQNGEEEISASLSILKIVLRIVLGVPLYLASVPNPINLVIDNGAGRLPLTMRLRNQSGVVDGAHICTIKNVHTISPEERLVLRYIMNQNRTGEEKRTISPHFRTGHWRRPPGKGSDPNAEKTVWVRPTLVNKSELPDGTLPEGSENRLV